MSAFDQLGFVPVEEIQNAFTGELDTIERDLRLNGIPSDPRIIINYINDIRERLLSKARGNLKEYLRENPHIKQEVREEKKKLEETNYRETWEKRIEKSRARTRSDV